MSSAINSKMTLQDGLMLIVLSALWGGSFFFVGVAIAELSPLMIVTVRLLFAAVALWVLALSMGYKIPRSRKIWQAFIGMGILNNAIPFMLIVWSQTHITSGLAAILNATTPIFTVVIAGILLADERMTKSKVVGVVIGFVGVIVLVGPSAMSGFGSNIVAQLAVLAAAVCYGVAGVYGRRYRTMGIAPMMAAAGQITASALLLLPFALLYVSPSQFAEVSTHIWLAIAALAIFSTALAYILYFRILASSGATNVVLVTFLVPVSAVLLGFFFLGEQLNPEHFIGMAIIAVGLSAIDGRIWERKIKVAA